MSQFNSTTHMARYAYVISPLSDKIRLVVASGGGPMLKYIVTEDDFRFVTTTMNNGEQLAYVLILANANKKGIQRNVTNTHSSALRTVRHRNETSFP